MSEFRKGTQGTGTQISVDGACTGHCWYTQGRANEADSADVRKTAKWIQLLPQEENEENAYIFECKNKVEGINTFLKQGRSDSFPFDDIVEAIHHIV